MRNVKQMLKDTISVGKVLEAEIEEDVLLFIFHLQIKEYKQVLRIFFIRLFRIFRLFYMISCNATFSENAYKK